MYIENNENNKDGPVENNNAIPDNGNNHSETKERKFLDSIKKGFVAWPDDQEKPKLADGEITEGRTKKGGYVAIPVNKN